MNNLDLQIVIITIMQLINLSKSYFSFPSPKKQQNVSDFLPPEIIPFDDLCSQKSLKWCHSWAQKQKNIGYLLTLFQSIILGDLYSFIFML